MQKRKFNTIKSILILIPIIIITGLIDRLPWWSFVVPVFIVGLLIGYLQWNIPTFTVGFLAGFIVWVGVNMFYDVTGNGIALKKIADVFSIPKAVVLLMAGLIGGLQTGLALFTGKRWKIIKRP